MAVDVTAPDEVERRRFWDRYAAAAALDRPDAGERAEQQTWDATLRDGLD